MRNFRPYIIYYLCLKPLCAETAIFLMCSLSRKAFTPTTNHNMIQWCVYFASGRVEVKVPLHFPTYLKFSQYMYAIHTYKYCTQTVQLCTQKGNCVPSRACLNQINHTFSEFFVHLLELKIPPPTPPYHPTPPPPPPHPHGRNGRHFAHDVFGCNFVDEKNCILIFTEVCF